MASVYKRGDIWWARLTYRGKDYRKSLETTSSRTANERLLTYIAEVKDGKWGDGGARRKFEDAINKFIDEHFPRIKPNSAKRYRVSLMNLVDHLQVKFLDEITSSVLSDFEVARRKQGVKDSTIRRDLVCLQVVFSCAEDWEWWFAANPVQKYLKKAKRRGFVEATPRDRFLTNQEEEALFAKLREMKSAAILPRDQHAYLMHEAAFACAIDTGLRDEELLSLRRGAINIARREVRIDGADAKSGVARVVPILPRSLDLLEELPRSKHSDYVFWHRDGKRYYELYRPLQKLCLRAGVAQTRFHDLRRTCGVRLLRDHGMSLEEVSKWLGHHDTKITQKVYAFLDVDQLHKAVENSDMRIRNN